MSNGHGNFVLSDQRAVTVRIHAGKITDVIAVRFQPSNHWIRRAEKPSVRIRHVERPVVDHFVGAANLPFVKTVPPEVVVCVPGCVGRLRQHVGMAGVIAHNKKHGTRLAGVRAWP